MKKYIKYVIDLVMSILFIVCIGYRVTGGLWHEILGVALFVLFVLHCILNGYWFTKYTKIAKYGRKNLAQMIAFITNNLVIIDMVVLGITSIMISRNLFTFLGLGHSFFVVWLHKACAYGGLILISIHLGCHWKGIITSLYRALHVNQESKVVKVISSVFALALIAAGVFSSFQKGMARHFIPRSFDGRPPMGKEGNFNPGQQNGINQGNGNGTGNGWHDGEHGRGYGRGKYRNNQGNVEENLHHSENQHASNDSAYTQVSYMTTSENVQDGESLDDYLGRLTCTGCGRQCSLLAPQCGRGAQQAQAATEQYNSSINKKSEDDATDSSNGNASNDQSENSSNGNTSNDQSENNSNGNASNDQSENNSNGNASNDQSINNHNGQNPRRMKISGDEDILSLFTGYIPIAGMYVAGTYYVLEFCKKKKKEK